MIIDDINDDKVRSFEVYCIKIDEKSQKTTVSYGVNYSNGRTRRQSTSLYDKPHGDFTRWLVAMQVMAKSMIELPIQNKDGEVVILNIRSIIFLDSNKYGYGVKFKIAITGLTDSVDPVIIDSPKYFAIAPHYKSIPYTKATVPMQELSWEDKQQLICIAREAIYFAFYGKREQPTLDEAAEAVKNGGYADELVEKEAEQHGQSQKPTA